MKRQTAVEWLISNLQQSKDWQRVLNEVSQMSTVQFNLLDQAKAMEKEQIIDSFGVGCQVESTRLIGYQDIAEQYYNETFKSE